MKKILLVILFIPLINFSHINDERLFKTSNVPSASLLLLDRSGSMGTTTYHYDELVTMSNYNSSDNRTELTGRFDNDFIPDGPGSMSDYDGHDANKEWILRVSWYDYSWSWVNLSWTLEILSNGTWHTFDGGNHTWTGYWWGNEREISINVKGLGNVEDIQCYLDIETEWGLTIGEMKIDLIETPLDKPYESTRIKDALMVIHSLLDANNDGFVTDDDEDYLQLNIGQGFHRSSNTYTPNESYGNSGYWRGEQYNESTGQWESAPDGELYTDDIGSGFSQIWDHINYTSDGGMTPNGPLLNEGIEYINNWKTSNPELWCMRHTIILITDGLSNIGGECSDGSDDVVRRAYRINHEDSVRVYAVGFGTGITEGGANELNWVAFHGGTQSADSAFIDSAVNAGMDTTAVDPSSGCPSAYPRNHHLDGYAYIAETADELASALAQIFSEIAGQKNQSYAAGEVTSVEEEFISTEYKARMFIASFQPDSMPVWRGDLKAIGLDTGSFNLDSIPKNLIIWSASDSLQLDGPDASSRDIYGINSNGDMLPFNSSEFDSSDLDVSNSTMAGNVIERVRDGLVDDNTGELGDIFHSSPLRIHLPNYFYSDQGYDYGAGSFYDTMKTRSALIYVGANDGMIHVIADSITGEADRGGEELAAVIPMNFVPKVKNMLNRHDYYVDADPVAADVWFPENQDDSVKSWDEWHTVLIGCQGEGGKSFTVLDVTDPLDETSHPVDELKFLFSAQQSGKLRDTLGWTTSTPIMHKVGVKWPANTGKTIDRFYAFMGGGQYPDSMDKRLLDSLFYNGEVDGNVIISFDIWEVSEIAGGSGVIPDRYINYIEPAAGHGSHMKAPFVAPPTGLNINPEQGNRYDMIFITDALGQLWFVDVREPDTSKWKAERIFKPELPTDTSEVNNWHPSFYAPLVWREGSGDFWICYGTGNRYDIMGPSESRFYALHYPDTFLTDTGGFTFSPFEESDLGTPGSPSDKGWMKEFTHNNEKVVTQAIYYKDSLKFYTFSPGSDTTLGPCEIGGTGTVARSYVYDIITGGTGNPDGTPEGTGIPQPPRYSYSLGGKAVEIKQIGPVIEIEEKASHKSFKEIIKWKEK